MQHSYCKKGKLFQGFAYFFVWENKNGLYTLFKLFRSIILSIKYGLMFAGTFSVCAKKCLSVYFLNNCLTTFFFVLPFIFSSSDEMFDTRNLL